MTCALNQWYRNIAVVVAYKYPSFRPVHSFFPSHIHHTFQPRIILLKAQIHLHTTTTQQHIIKITNMSLETIGNSPSSEWLEVQEPWHFRESSDSCPICTENTIADIVKTICGHNYHAKCLLGWHKSEQDQFAKTELSCPMCRSVLAVKEQGGIDLEELEDSYWYAGAFDLFGNEEDFDIEITADFEACFAHLLCQSPSPPTIPDAEQTRVSEEFPLATHQPASVQH